MPIQIGYNTDVELLEKINTFRAKLVNQYGKIVSDKVLNTYLPPETSVIVNDDPDMYPVELKLPKPPPWHKIDGFGLSTEHQYFRPPKLPDKLKDLVKTSKTNTEIWEKIKANKTFYRDEIEYIQKQWNYRLYGYWFWNNGVPTYIDGWHYFYCGYWNLDVGLPKYRYRDRLWFLFARYCYTTTEAPYFYRVKNTNIETEDVYKYFSTEKQALVYCENNSLTQVPEKGFWLIDKGHRTCYGFNNPKHRREGATFRASCVNYEVTSRLEYSHGVIQSMDGEAAKKTFKEKMLYPIKKIPFFFLPSIMGSIDSDDGIVFDTKVGKSGTKGIGVISEFGLGSSIHPSTSADDRKEDGNKYVVVHGDEVGKANKARPYNITTRYEVMKKTVAQFPIINGLILHTSTSDDTKGEAGRRYMELCKGSHWHERDSSTGFTETGMFNLYVPAFVNLEGFSDKHGNPIIEKPTTKQQLFCGFNVGAKEMLFSSLEQKKSDPEKYYHLMREMPISFRQCFMSSGEDSGFDILSIVERINELDMNDNLKVRIGNMEWTNGFGSKVEFIDKPDGKFEMSYYPDNPNAYITKNGKMLPANTNRFIAACDPFRFDTTRKKRHSKGGGAVFLNRDKVIDPDDKDVALWETERFCCTYSNAVPQDDYHEDMLKMAVFYGCEIFPEMNEENTYRYINKTKYKHYLGYLYPDGVKDILPGVYTSRNKPLYFKLMKIHIERNIAHERHKELLREITTIEKLEDMKDYDLFASACICLYAKYYSKQEFFNNDNTQKTGETDIVDWIKMQQRQ